MEISNCFGKIILFTDTNGEFNNEAIGAGIYLIEISKDERIWIPLYIGESKTMLLRAGYHLYNALVGPKDWGLCEEDIKNKEIKVRVSILELIFDNKERKIQELKWIEKIKPKIQGITSDRQLSLENKIKNIENALSNN